MLTWSPWELNELGRMLEDEVSKMEASDALYTYQWYAPPPGPGANWWGRWGVCLKNSLPGVGQLYNYVLYHYDITVLKLAHAHTFLTYACVFCVSLKCFVVKFL